LSGGGSLRRCVCFCYLFASVLIVRIGGVIWCGDARDRAGCSLCFLHVSLDSVCPWMVKMIVDESFVCGGM